MTSLLPDHLPSSCCFPLLPHLQPLLCLVVTKTPHTLHATLLLHIIEMVLMVANLSPDVVLSLDFLSATEKTINTTNMTGMDVFPIHTHGPLLYHTKDATNRIILGHVTTKSKTALLKVYTALHLFPKLHTDLLPQLIELILMSMTLSLTPMTLQPNSTM